MLYKNGQLVGALGVSGDGVEQNDLIAFEGGAGFEPPPELRIDNFEFDGVKLPYLKFPETPLIGAALSNGDEVGDALSQTGPNLKPWPLQAATAITRGSAGSRIRAGARLARRSEALLSPVEAPDRGEEAAACAREQRRFVHRGRREAEVVGGAARRCWASLRPGRQTAAGRIEGVVRAADPAPDGEAPRHVGGVGLASTWPTSGAA